MVSSSSGQPYPPHSSMAEHASYATGHYEHGYGYESHAHNPDQAPPPNAYSTQYHQYTHDGVYYDSTGVPTTVAAAAPAGQEQSQYDYQAYYYNTAEGGQYESSAYSAPPPAPPPDILPVVTKTAEYVAKNGDAFERTVIERHAGDPRFGFLNPWDKSHAYYQALKQQSRQRIAYEAYAAQMGLEQNPGMGQQDVYSSETEKEGVASEPTNLQKLSEWGTVKFKLQGPKPTKVFDRSSLVDLGTMEDVGEEGSENCNGVEEEEGEPPSKKACLESTKMGTKVEEFLSTVKAMLGTE